jgi:transcriptional regulator with XRE-family HTH domain
MDRMRLVDKVLKLAKDKRITQAQLATMIGAHPSRLSEWKNDEGKPSIAQALRMARVLDVSLDYLADDSMDEPPVRQELPEDEKALLRLYRALKPALGEDEAMRRLAGQSADGREAPRSLPRVGPLPGQSEAELSRREEEEREAPRRKGKKGAG